MRTLLAAAMALTLGVSKAQNCDPAYECKYHYQTTKHLWYYDFTSSCTAGNEQVWHDKTRQDSTEFIFELCGGVEKACGGSTKQGTVIQSYVDTEGVHCQLVGHGAPLYSPWVQSNQDIPPAGINISFLGENVNDLADNPCRPDPVTGILHGRSIVFMVACDPSVAGVNIPESSAYQAIVESPECTYTAYASSKLACAVRYTGPDASADATGDPNQYIGLDGGSAFGCVVGGAAIAFAFWAGIGYARTGKLPFLSGGGSSGGFSTGLAAGGSSAAATPSFGGTSGVGAGGGYGQVA